MNSLSKRLTALLSFLAEHSVDVALLQELKLPAERFPSAAIESAGWRVAFVAEKGYNGVAVLSRDRAMVVRRSALPAFSSEEDTDVQARYLEVATHGIVVVCLYAPNGNPVSDSGDNFSGIPTTSSKFRYKLSWMDRLCRHIEDRLLVEGCPFLLGGDFNVCPQAGDVFDEQIMSGDALLHEESRGRYRRLICSGLVDAYRALALGKQQQGEGEGSSNGYTYWDYRRGRFQRDEGLRIDMFFLSPYLSERLESCFVAGSLRALENPSDHTPLCLDLSYEDRVSSKGLRAVKSEEAARAEKKGQSSQRPSPASPPSQGLLEM